MLNYSTQETYASQSRTQALTDYYWNVMGTLASTWTAYIGWFTSGGSFSNFSYYDWAAVGYATYGVATYWDPYQTVGQIDYEFKMALILGEYNNCMGRCG